MRQLESDYPSSKNSFVVLQWNVKFELEMCERTIPQ